MLFPENIRRYKRANDYFQTAADSVRQRNDAADRLLDLWLLNPVSPRLSRYMSMLYHAYIEGRQAETVILSRTVLERAVSDAGGSHNATANSSMNARITQLLNRGRLSREAAADARAIWHRGNKVIHEDADFDVDAFDTIRCLLHILTELRTEIAG
jgi:hypothetical protein